MTEDLPKIAHTSVPASTRPRTLASSAGLRPARRVAPKATILACFQVIVRACSKNAASFGLDPGQPPSMNATPSSSSLRAMRSLSSTEYEMPSVCPPSRRVVSKISMQSDWVETAMVDQRETSVGALCGCWMRPVEWRDSTWLREAM